MFCMGKSTSFIITLSSLISSTATFSNNFGSDIVFTGAIFVLTCTNLVFDVTNEQCGLSALSKSFKYSTVLDATYDASQNLTHCNWTSEAL